MQCVLCIKTIWLIRVNCLLFWLLFKCWISGACSLLTLKSFRNWFKSFTPLFAVSPLHVQVFTFSFLFFYKLQLPFLFVLMYLVLGDWIKLKILQLNTFLVCCGQKLIEYLCMIGILTGFSWNNASNHKQMRFKHPNGTFHSKATGMVSLLSQLFRCIKGFLQNKIHEF